MIYLTQLIFIIPGQEKVFDEFENVAIRLIAKYNGSLLLRIRPNDNSYLENNMDKPYAIHLVQFDSEKDFRNFMQDEDRKKFLHLKNQSIKSSMLIQGNKI
jgi:uncharacterized protein (DUF1330 family)